MRKLLSNLLLLLLPAAAFMACNGSVESYSEFYFRNIYSIKDGGNPNFLFCDAIYADTAYPIKKSEAMGLNAGERAYLGMKSEFDAYSMSKPQVTLLEILAKYTPRPMSAKGSFDATLYNDAFTSVDAIVFSDYTKGFESPDFLRTWEFYDYLWADSETQNVAVRYNKELNCSPKMTVDSLRNGTLYFRLYANIENRGWGIDNEAYEYDNFPGLVGRILSFKMDWDMIYNELTAAEREEIVTIDSLRSNISLVVDGCIKDKDGMYVPKGAFTNSRVRNSKFANGLYKRK